jgi:hypothetical protein
MNRSKRSGYEHPPGWLLHEHHCTPVHRRTHSGDPRETPGWIRCVPDTEIIFHHNVFRTADVA